MRQPDRGEVCAIFENVLADRDDAVGHFDARKPSAAIEGMVTNPIN